MSFCGVCSSKETANVMSASEAIELIEERSRHIQTQVAYQEHQMSTEAKHVRRYAHAKDMEQARVHMRRIRFLKDKRTRYLGVKEKLWAMKHTLDEQSVYNTLHETFQSGVEVMDSLLKKVDMDKIEDMMDRFQEQADNTHDISQALSTEIDVLESDDIEQGIERELQLLLAGVEDQPILPTKEKTHQKEQEEAPENVGRKQRQLAV